MTWTGLLLLAAGQTWTLVCGGDIMLNGLSPSPKRLAVAVPLLKSATVAMANLEVPITSARVPTSGKSAAEVQARTQYILKADPGHAKFLPAWGFRILTEGNNHAMDYRGAGLAQELHSLDKLGIGHTGAGMDREKAWTPVDFPLGNGESLRVGAALSFAGAGSAAKCTPATPTRPGVATLYLQGTEGKAALVKLVTRLRNGNGPVILYLHWGTERAPVPRAYQVALGRACIDAGADAVLGAHPHVLEGAEIYKGKPILYSLGNLIAPNVCDIAFASLTFEGRRFVSCQMHPFQNRGGVLRRYKNAELKRALANFADLGRRIQKQFPNPNSQILSGS